MGEDLNWKELKIDKLPEDILTGSYDVECSLGGDPFEISQLWNNNNRFAVLGFLMDKVLIYRYRKPEPKQPTHEEIMTKWWKKRGFWHLVEHYDSGGKSCYSIDYYWESLEFFKGRESADIPPE